MRKLIVLGATSLMATVALIIVATSGSWALAQGSVPPVTNIVVCSGPDAGEVVISWDSVSQATYYRIGYVNMVKDYPRAKASATGEWIEAFVYVDVNARNIPATGGRGQYTLRRLVQGDRHAFTVLTSNNVVNTVETISGHYSWPLSPRWAFHTVTNPSPNCTAASPLPPPQSTATATAVPTPTQQPTDTPRPTPTNTPTPSNVVERDFDALANAANLTLGTEYQATGCYTGVSGDDSDGERTYYMFTRDGKLDRSRPYIMVTGISEPENRCNNLTLKFTGMSTWYYCSFTFSCAFLTHPCTDGIGYVCQDTNEFMSVSIQWVGASNTMNESLKELRRGQSVNIENFGAQ